MSINKFHFALQPFQPLITVHITWRTIPNSCVIHPDPANMVARHHGQAKYSGLLSFSRSIRITCVLIAAANDDIASSDTDEDNTSKGDIDQLCTCLYRGRSPPAPSRQTSPPSCSCSARILITSLQTFLLLDLIQLLDSLPHFCLSFLKLSKF